MKLSGRRRIQFAALALAFGLCAQADVTGSITPLGGGGGSGTVTSIGILSTDGCLNVTGSPVTTSGSISLALSPLSVTCGGTGKTSPSLVAGTNVTISGTWPNQTITAVTPVSQIIAGTGISVSPSGGTGTVTVSATGVTPGSPAGTVQGVPITASGPQAPGAIPGAAVTVGSAGLTLRDVISIKDYVNTAATGYVPARLSGPLSGYTSNITTNGTTTVTSTAGGTWSASDVGDVIVIFQEGTSNVFQSTISAVNSGTSITVAATPGFSTTSAKAYFGTDSTTAINAALAAAIAAGKCLYIPSGGYFYGGTGANGWQAPCVVGDDDQTSLLFLGASSFLIDDNIYLIGANMARVGYIGGLGAYRNRYSGTDIASGPIVFESNFFYDYQNAAVSFETSDLTYYRIEKNTFSGLNTSISVGFALLGSDLGSISFNAFINYRYAVKLGTGGINARIFANDFIQFSTDNTDQRASLWIVPGSNSNGLTVFANKLGNENIGTNDVRFLLADTNTSSGGNYFGNTTPKTTVSTNYITNAVFEDNLFASGATSPPLFYSYTPNFRQNKITGIFASGSPSYIVYFDPSVTAANDYTTKSNIFGPFQWPGYGASSFSISNIAGYGMASDPSDNEEFYDPLSITPWTTGAGPGGYTNYLPTRINSYNIIGSGSKAQIADRFGGTDAATFTMGAAGSGNEFYAQANAYPALSTQTWMEFDARQGSSGTSITQLTAGIYDSYSSPPYCTRTINLSATWHHYKIPCVFVANPVHGYPNVQFLSGSGSAVGNTVDIGMVRYYGATEPVGGGLFLTPVQHQGLIDTGNTFTASGSGGGCGTLGTKTGGAASGSVATATVTACQFTVTFGGGLTGKNGSSCWVNDDTTPTDVGRVGPTTATTAVFNFPTITAGDTIKFGCNLW